jgi:short-subunit dehydrogenase
VELQKKFKIKTITRVLDLSEPDAWLICKDVTAGLDCRLMVYVAAFSIVKPFLQVTSQEIDRFLAVNNRTLIHVVYDFAGGLREKGGGGILLVSSLSGVIPPPLVASYAATKAFIIRLTESLYGEFKPLGIRIGCCTLGIISTPTFWKGNPAFGMIKPPIGEPVETASYALRKLGKTPVCTPGFSNRMSYFILGLLPRRTALSLVSRTMKSMYKIKAG